MNNVILSKFTQLHHLYVKYTAVFTECHLSTIFATYILRS